MPKCPIIFTVCQCYFCKLNFSPLITDSSVQQTLIAQGPFENLQTLCGLQIKLKALVLFFKGKFTLC
jgi:hypothetical protein